MGMHELTDQAAVESLIAASEAAWVFKHSLTCGTSAWAYEEVVRYSEAHPDERIGVVTVQTHRAISNWIATRLGRVHQSPQLFLVRGGDVVWATSHGGIRMEAMEQARGTGEGTTKGTAKRVG
jgi:bacillithiol system protein YtxJ